MTSAPLDSKQKQRNEGSDPGFPLREHVALDKYLTINTGGHAERFVQVGAPQEISAVLEYVRDQRLDLHVLGHGSNVVVADSGLPGLTLCIRDERPQLRTDAHDVTVRAGTSWPSAAVRSARLGLAGLEAGVGIPGSIGGAVCMNAGIPQSTIAEHLIDCLAVDINTGREYVLKKAQLNFGHRTSLILQQKHLLVVQARFKLYRDQPAAINKRIKALMSERREKQPYDLPSAGCTFRRQEGVLPGLLIDQGGLKGLHVGDAQVSLLHANFIVNLGAARAQDIYELAGLVQHRVLQQDSVLMTPEVQFLGEFNPAATGIELQRS